MAEQFPPASPGTYDKPEVNTLSAGSLNTGPISVVDPSVSADQTAEGLTVPLFSPRKPKRRSALIRKAQSALRAADAPTWGMDLREINDGIEKARSRGVIDLAMRIAESTLSTGASAAEVTGHVLAITRAYGLRSVHVDVTFTSIAVTHHRGADEDPVTMVRIVRVRVPDYDRLAATHELIDEITQGNLPLIEARQRFLTIMSRPHLYRRWVITVSFVLLGGGVAALFGGRLIEIFMAMLISAVVDRALIWTGRRHLPAFFGQMVGGAIPTTVAMLIVAVRGGMPPGADEIRPSVLVSTGIVLLLAGLSVVGAAQDAIDGYYVTAAARSFEVVVLTLGVLVGVLGVITIASRVGVPAYIIPPSSLAESVWVQLVAAGVIGISYALGCYSSLRTILVSVGLAVLGWFVYVLLERAGFDVVSATAGACLVLGFLSQPIAWLAKVPSLAISTAGIVAFLPGSMVYRGLYYLVEPAAVVTPETDGAALLVTAAAIGLAVSGGVSLGAYFGRQVRLSRTPRRGASDRALERNSASIPD